MNRCLPLRQTGQMTPQRKAWTRQTTGGQSRRSLWISAGICLRGVFLPERRWGLTRPQQQLHSVQCSFKCLVALMRERRKRGTRLARVILPGSFKLRLEHASASVVVDADFKHQGT